MSSVSSTFSSLFLAPECIATYLMKWNIFQQLQGKVKDARVAEMPEWQRQALPPKYKLWRGVFSVRDIAVTGFLE